MYLLQAILLLVILDSVKPQPVADFKYTLDPGWPMSEELFGDIAGVDVDKDNNVIIFHRGNHHWVRDTFSKSEVYAGDQESPIMEATVVTINPRERKVIRAWGKGKFFMPHGLSLDREAKTVWLTDCALHQVFKYSIETEQELLAIGTAFTPGNDDTHFCKPTSVAETGEFVFVADGYCNSRIAMFTPGGRYLGELGQSSPFNLISGSDEGPTFYIPHKIVYAHEAEMLCVADRENGRIQCFSYNGHNIKSGLEVDSSMALNPLIPLKFTIADPSFNGRLFSVDYSPIKGGILTAVSGESLGQSPLKPPMGFVYNVTSGSLLSTFSPPKGKIFGMAHDLAITGGLAESIFVVDITPVHLWRFSRPVNHALSYRDRIPKMDDLSKAMTLLRNREQEYKYLWYLLIITVFIAILIFFMRTRKFSPYGTSDSLNALYSHRYSSSINSLFGGSISTRRLNSSRAASFLSTTFSRRAFFNLFNSNLPQNDFSRVPLHDSDITEDDKSDSDVEEFNINQATTSIKINV